MFKNNKNLKTNNISKGEIVIYRAKDGIARLDVKLDLDKETVWLNLNQIALLFNIDKSGISRHIKNIFDSHELDETPTVAIFATVQKEGGRFIKREVDFYNLDMIISIGYRVNSKRATEFRVWATQVLKKHIIDGYTINQKRLKEQELNKLESAIKLLQITMQNKKITSSEAKGLLQIITDYADSWILLQQYDQGKLKIQKSKIKKIQILDYESVKNSIKEFKNKLAVKKQASDIFGQERDQTLQGILGSISQSFGGKEFYPSLEEKSAHLLYFVIKDHPFVDGNKRIASFLFILFLKQNRFLFNKKGENKINNNALVALTLLVAQSLPKEKDVMIALITNLIKNK
ncbi:type II toxin-antitoxin system death-on-curing family toxin [Patescibacteria group bacterium]|nr:type II toxin-antitoxin system death-on-curing family toxin [Patescibacteria group bacterium]